MKLAFFQKETQLNDEEDIKVRERTKKEKEEEERKKKEEEERKREAVKGVGGAFGKTVSDEQVRERLEQQRLAKLNVRKAEAAERRKKL